MIVHWAKHFVTELVQPGGWSLAVKAIAGIVALTAGLVTVASFSKSQRLRVSDSVHTRMSTIQAGLLSESESSRIAALRSLRIFAVDPTVTNVSDETLRAEARQFSRRSLLDSLEAAKPELRAVVADDTATRRMLSAQERYEILATFEHIGIQPWIEGQSARMIGTHPEYALDFTWLSRVPRYDLAASEVEVAAALSGFDFTRLRLNKVRFDCLALGDSRFDGAELRQVYFEHAKLEGASFTGAHMEYAAFTGSSLRSASFDDTQLIGTTFSQPGSLSGSPSHAGACGSFPTAASTYQNTQATAASFQNAHIYEGEFNGAAMPASHFETAKLSNVAFRNTELTGATFHSAQLSGTDFNLAALEGASFVMSTLSNTKFDDANLKNASFKAARFVDAATIESISRARSLEGTNFAGATGLAQDQVCALLKAGAVLIDREKEWSAEGRPREAGSIRPFMSELDRILVLQCGS